MALQPRHRWLAMRVLEYYRITDATVVEEAFREDAAFKLLSKFLGGTLNAVFISYSLERVVDPVRSPKTPAPQPQITTTTTTSVHAVSNLHPQPTTHTPLTHQMGSQPAADSSDDDDYERVPRIKVFDGMQGAVESDTMYFLRHPK